VVVAPFQRFAAEVLGGEMEALDARTHRAIVDEDALRECAQKGRFGLLVFGSGDHVGYKNARTQKAPGRRFSVCLTWPQFA
jgi:hypothetical protein